MNILSENEKYLFDSLSREELAIFEQYSEAWSYVNNEAVRDAFKNGFRLGAKFATDVYAD